MQHTYVNPLPFVQFSFHVTTACRDGLYGPLVVHAGTTDEQKYDTEQVLTLADVYHTSASALLQEYLTVRLFAMRLCPCLPVPPLTDVLLPVPSRTR